MSKISEWIAAFKTAEANEGNITVQPEKKPELKAVAEHAATEAKAPASIDADTCGAAQSAAEFNGNDPELHLDNM